MKPKSPVWVVIRAHYCDGPIFAWSLKRHNNLFYGRPIMDKHIGFDIDSNKTIACVVQNGRKDRFTTLRTDIGQMKTFLQKERKNGERLHLTFY
jgi:hypothetical protein